MSPEELKTLQERGISPEVFESQIRRFATGFPYLKIIDSARVGNGITSLNDEEQQKAVDRWSMCLMTQRSGS